jgi:drug/metabolite transporter (DMT)-like permease
VSAAVHPAAPDVETAAVPVGHLRGIGFALLGLFLFAMTNAAMKWVMATYPVSEALAARSAVTLLYLAPLVRVSDVVELRRRLPRHLLRMMTSALEMTCFFTAVTALPLADASVFYLATPIYVTALSPWLLGETVGWRRWVAVIVGFLGVLIALHPSREALSAPALVALCGGMLFAVVVIMTRGLRGTSNRMLIATQIGAVLLVALARAGSDWVVPTFWDAALMVATGTVSLLAYAAFNHSLRVTPASVVAPFQYSSIIWAMLSGYMIFGEIPGAATLMGAAVIVGAGLFILWRERESSAG